MLVNNSYVAGLEKETAAAARGALGTIAGAMIFIFRAAVVGVQSWISKIYMAFRDPGRVWHIHAGRS